MSSFRLHSGDAEFNSRVDALFSSLQTAAVHLQPQLKRPREDDSLERDTSATNEDDRNSHEFRRPRGVPFGCRGRRSFGPRNTTPDYVKNPHNWTRYSMKDTKVLSDRENTQVGLRLLDELRTRRTQDEEQEDQDMSSNDSPKIVFKKPTKSTENDKETKDDSSLNCSLDAVFGGAKKYKMTEYVVGKSKQNKVKKANLIGKVDMEAEATDKQIKLGHLSYEEEEDE